MKNNNIKIIQTKKYKDISLYLRFSFENKPQYKECLALLGKMLGDISNKYETKDKMSKIRDMLYGIELETNYKCRGNITSFSIHYSFINPKFVDVTIDDYVDYINETLFNTIINNKTLKEAKMEVVSAIERALEKPNTYATQRFIEEVAKDNKSYSVNMTGKKFIASVKKVKLEDVLKVYKFILNKAQLNIYLCGDLDNKTIKSLTNFNFEGRKPINFKPCKLKTPSRKDIVENKDMGQSVLYSIYSFPYNKSSKEFFAWFTGNVFLGSLPTSLLFEEVREKLSLCYTIGVTDFKNDGLIRIATFIDAKNKDLVLSQIELQIKRIINKDYDFDKFEISKTLLINSLMSTYDDLDALVDYYYESLLANFNYSLESFCAKIQKVTPDDIANTFMHAKHYFNYFLKGNKHD